MRNSDCGQSWLDTNPNACEFRDFHHNSTQVFNVKIGLHLSLFQSRPCPLGDANGKAWACGEPWHPCRVRKNILAAKGTHAMPERNPGVVRKEPLQCLKVIPVASERNPCSARRKSASCPKEARVVGTKHNPSGVLDQIKVG